MLSPGVPGWEWAEKEVKMKTIALVQENRIQLNLLAEGSMMTTPAIAIKTEIHELIDLQIQVFGQPTPLTPFELADCRRRAEKINSLGRELDQLNMRGI